MFGQINHVVLQGRLTRDPELRQTTGGASVCEFTLACDRYYKDSNDQQQEETLFAPVTVWGRQAENCDQYLAQGRETIVEGRLKLDQWETDNGQKRSRMKIIANNVQFLGEANGNGEGGSQSGGSADQSGGGGTDDEDFGDIPF